MKLRREDEEHMMLISGILTLPFLLGGVLYLMYLYFNGFVDYNQGILYTFLMLYPLSVGLWLTIHEILISRKIRKPLALHVKRFLFRMGIVSSYAMIFAVFWIVFTSFLLQFVSWRYILILALLASSLSLAILVAIPRTRRIIQRFTSYD
jgi:MFS family permease